MVAAFLAAAALPALGRAVSTPAAARTAPARLVAAAYVPYWDQQRGLREAQNNAATFDEISPWWYSFDDTGAVVVQDGRVTVVDPAAVTRLQTDGVRVLPTLADHRQGAWVPGAASAVLADPARRQALARHIDELVAARGYDGIDLDFEALAGTDRRAFSSFVSSVAALLHRRGKKLVVTVQPKESDAGYSAQNAAQDYRAIGRAADEVRVMAYDLHWSGSEPGPVAPTAWVANVVRFATSEIPSARLQLGVPLHGYDWADGQGQPVTWGEATRLAAARGAVVHWDPVGASNTFTYASGGITHTVWFGDARSVAAALGVAQSAHLGGVFLWRLGDSDPAVWRVLDQRGA